LVKGVDCPDFPVINTS